MNPKLVQKFNGCLLGLAAGDALGTTLEFQSPGSFEPIVDMEGGGPFNLQPGEWTDDTSMALCLATSLIERHGFDADDQMKKYCDWWDNGYLSSNGRCFDIGNTVRSALLAYKETGDPLSGSTAASSAGNGSIMRLAPIPMYYYPNLESATHYAAESSRTTHGAIECVEATQLLTRVLFKTFDGLSKSDIVEPDNEDLYESARIDAIARGSYRAKGYDDIVGSGYVVESLEAALWCFYTTESFREAVLKAANLGDDADTTAAICGQVAGAYYGIDSIPHSWREKLAMRSEILKIAERLLSKT